jgi:Transposase domain (DUF772)
MAKTYRAYLPEQDLLLAPSLGDWLPEDHLAYFVSDVVDQLDLRAIESVYEEEERGQPPYHPRMMTKLLIYGYCVGVFSSRRMPGRNSSALKRGSAETSSVFSTPITLWLNSTRTPKAGWEPMFLIEIDSSPRSKTKSTIT